MADRRPSPGSAWTRTRPRRRTALVLTSGAVLAVSMLAAGCSGGLAATTKPGVVYAVGAENQYANVLSQIGGRYVQVSSILDNPNTDPHTFEASPTVAQEVGRPSSWCRTASGTTPSWTRSSPPLPIPTGR